MTIDPPIRLRVGKHLLLICLLLTGYLAAGGQCARAALPVITSSATAAGYVNYPFAYTITATNGVTSYGATGLPAGLTLNTSTGLISGTVGVTGSSTITISASNTSGVTNEMLAISIWSPDFESTSNWPTFGNGPDHAGYQPLVLGTGAYTAGWSVSYSGSALGLNQAAVSEGMVFVTMGADTGNTYICGLSATNGAQVWSYAFGAGNSINPPTVDSGKVYTQFMDNSENCTLYAFDAGTGGIDWSSVFYSQWATFMASTVFGGSVWIDGSALVGYNANNGNNLFYQGGTSYNAWTPAYSNGVVYTWINGVFSACNPITGGTTWSLNIGGGFNGYSMNTAPALSQGYAYVEGVPNLYGINLNNETIAFTITGTFSGSPAVANGILYGINGTTVSAYNAQTGALLKSYSTGDKNIGGQPLVTVDSLIVSSPSNTYLFNLQNQNPRQTIHAGGAASLANAVLYLSGTDSVLRTYVPTVPEGLVIQVPPSETKDAGIVSGTVSSLTSSTSDLVVSLVSSATSRATVPTTVTIPAGQTSATFPINVIDDGQLDGTQQVTISVEDTGYPTASGTMTIDDSQTATITVSAPAAEIKNQGIVTGTVSISATPASDVTINLSSSNTNAATVPATMIIAAGQTSGTFPIAIVNDGYIDGGQNTTITAQETGWTSGSASLTASDDIQLSLLFPGSVGEGAGVVTGTIEAGGTIFSPLSVSLLSSNSASIGVPAVVTIPAGSASVPFNLTVNDNAQQGPNQTVTITGTAPGFPQASASVTVLNNNAASYVFSAIFSPLPAGIPFPITISAEDASGKVLTGFNGVVNLQANPGFTVSPSITGTFNNGVWTGEVTVGGSGAGAILSATDAQSGVSTQSNAFTLVAGDYDSTANWPTFGNNPARTGYQASVLAGSVYVPGWSFNYNISSPLGQVAISGSEAFVTAGIEGTAGLLSAVNITTGSEAWRYNFGKPYSVNAPTVDSGKVYVQFLSSSEVGTLYSFNAGNGSVNWSAPYNSQWSGFFAPTVFQNGIWIQGGQFGGMYGFSVTTGSQAFFNPNFAQTYGPWEPTYYQGNLYTWVSNLFAAYNPATGAQAWKVTINSATQNTVPAIDNGMAYLVGGLNLYSVNLSTQASAWTVDGTFTETPAAANGSVYVLAYNTGVVDAFSEATGALQGFYKTGDSQIYGQPIVTLDSLIISSPAKTYIFNLSSHQIVQTLPAGGRPSLANRILYLAGTDGVLRTYDLDSVPGVSIVLPGSTAANSGTVTGMIEVNPIPSSPISISLLSSNPQQLSVPANVTVASGSAYATFPVTVIGGAQPSGPNQVTITGSASGLSPGAAAITIYPVLPVLGSGLTAYGQMGEELYYGITAANYPVTFGAGSLPAGLTVNTLTGLISGTPTVTGTFQATITAGNSAGTGSGSLTFFIAPQAPVITSTAAVTGTVGKALSYQIAGSHSPTSFSGSGFPPGLVLNGSNGIISGTPTATGTYAATIYAGNWGGSGSEPLTFTILPPAPVITSTLAIQIVVGSQTLYQITATNNPTGYGAVGLPAGLTISTSSGVISGTPGTSGTFVATIAASNPQGTGTAALIFLVPPRPPIIQSATSAPGVIGTAFGYQILGTNNPTSFSATGLPAGISVDSSSGLISGTPAVTGTFLGEVAASNWGGSGSSALTYVIAPQPPVITSGSTGIGRVGRAFHYHIAGTSGPTSFSAAMLPPGLSVDNSLGIISGTPAASGTFGTTIYATNWGGTGTGSLTLTIAPPSPVIASPEVTDGVEGVAFSYQIAASNNPTSFNASGMPAGIAVDPSTGLISGTPTVSGTFTGEMTASNWGSSGSSALVFIIAPQPPAITSGSAAGGMVGAPFAYQIAGSNNPTEFDAASLPPGISLNESTGLISGTPATSGTFAATIYAANWGGIGSAPLILAIAPLAPVITSGSAASGMIGTEFSYRIVGTDAPSAYSASGLPAGLGVNASTGVISGTPSLTGTFGATIYAINWGGTGSGLLSITIVPQPPVITSSTTATGMIGMPFTYQITGSNSPTSFASTGLPPGITVDASAGLISGTPTETGTFAGSITAGNAGGTGTSGLMIFVEPQPPVVTSSASATGTIGFPFSYQVDATNSPGGFDATGLPPGLIFDVSSGVLSGTPGQTGTFQTVVSAANWGGTGSETLAITILPQVPVITSGTAVRAATGIPFAYQITAVNEPATFGAAGLPPGIAINPATGLISGTAISSGTYDATISAANISGTGSGSLVLSVASSFGGIKGAYTGLGSVSGTNVAFFSATVTSKGGLTASLKLAGAKYSLKGTFNPAGFFSGASHSGGSVVTSELAADPSRSSIDGTIGIATASGTQSYRIDSSLAGKFNAHTIPPGLAGRYTLVLASAGGTDATLPGAPGFATMTVSDAGGISMKGELGDGTAFATSGALHSDGMTWALFQPIYGNGAAAGSIAGEVTFQPRLGSDANAVLDWIKPAQRAGAYYPQGFATSVDMAAGVYTPPPMSGTASIVISGGNLPGSLLNDIAISETGAIFLLSGNSDTITLKLTPATGGFTGSFRAPAADKKTTFQGVIYQKQPGGFGVFLGTDQSGAVKITP